MKTTVDVLKEVNLGTDEDRRPTYVSASLNVVKKVNILSCL